MSEVVQLPLRPVDEDRLGGVHRGDPLTSRAAAQANLPRSGSQRRLVLAAVLAAADGLTAEEAADRVGLPSTASGNSAAKRLSELKQDGWVVPSGRTRRTRVGEAAQVMVATPAALKLFESAA